MQGLVFPAATESLDAVGRSDYNPYQSCASKHAQCMRSLPSSLRMRHAAYTSPSRPKSLATYTAQTQPPRALGMIRDLPKHQKRARLPEHSLSMAAWPHSKSSCTGGQRSRSLPCSDCTLSASHSSCCGTRDTASPEACRHGLRAAGGGGRLLLSCSVPGACPPCGWHA